MKFNGLIIYIAVIPGCGTFGRWMLSLLVACNIWDLWDLFHCCWHSHRLRLVSAHNLTFNHIYHIKRYTQPDVKSRQHTECLCVCVSVCTHILSAYTSSYLLPPLCWKASVSVTRLHRGNFLFVKVKSLQQLSDFKLINTTLQAQWASIFTGEAAQRLQG